MSVATDDARLWKQVDQLLTRRPRWKFQARPTPGMPPAWCLGPEGEPDLTVTVDGGSICVYVTRTEYVVTVKGTDELVAWLNDYRPDSLAEQRGRVLDKFKRGHLFEWE